MDNGKLEGEFLLLAQNHSKWQCAVCLDLLFKPVYCPKKCNKTTILCEQCMDGALQNNQHRCPICNCKLIRWNRNRENFHDKKMWHEIKTQIPGLCKLRASGEDVMGRIEDPSKVSRKECSLAQTGEIAEELRKEQAKLDAQRKQEDIQNEQLLKAFLEANPEYAPAQPKCSEEDEAFARQLQTMEEERLEQQQKQEQQDAEMALKLQRQFDDDQATPEAFKHASGTKKRKIETKAAYSKRSKKKNPRKGMMSKWLQTPDSDIQVLKQKF